MKPNTIESILKNEKYKGSALLQKTFTVDFLTKKIKANEGEVPQYFIEDSHEAIIDPKEFELVQAEIARRKSIRPSYSGNTIFASRIVCGDCGSYYGAKTWHSNSKYRKIIYRCFNKYTKKQKCRTPHLTETDIKETFVAAFNTIITDKATILDACRVMLDTLTNTVELDSKIAKIEESLEFEHMLIEKHVQENMHKTKNQTEFWQRYEEIEKRTNDLAAELDTLKLTKLQRMQKSEMIGAFISEISNRNGVIESFDERLWNASVDKITVYHTGEMLFRFKNGLEIRQKRR